MIDNDTIQMLRRIVAEMGSDRACEDPKVFAGAILDMCDANDVKLLTNVLRANYSTKLMDYFRSGNSDAATWIQQKAFLIDESGMSVKNAESVLDALWKAMDWQRPRPSQPEKTPKKKPEKEPERSSYPETDPKYRIEVIDPGGTNTSKGKNGENGRNNQPTGQGESGHNNGAGSNSDPGTHSDPDPRPQPQAQQGASKWVPVLISAVWLFLAYRMNQDDGTGDLLIRIQNGDYQLLLFLAAPVIATLFVCAKGVPKLLRGLGAVVLGFTAGYNFFISLYWMDAYCIKTHLLLGDSTAGIILTVLLSFIALAVGISGGAECGKIRE